MKKVPVTSSSLKSVGYDAQKQILEIEFKSGEVYQYYNVPEEKHKSLMMAPSQGKYFHSNIRNCYENHKMR